MVQVAELEHLFGVVMFISPWMDLKNLFSHFRMFHYKIEWSSTKNS